MDTFSPTRRHFFRGSLHRRSGVFRPPWAVVPSLFLDRCNRCDACLTACPTGIIVKGDGGYPTIDFSVGECTFCGDCTRACSKGALQPSSADIPPWTLRAHIGKACVTPRGIDCRICGEICQTQAIRFRPQAGGIAQPHFDAGQCSGCGACVAPCPTQAIIMEAFYANC